MRTRRTARRPGGAPSDVNRALGARSASARDGNGARSDGMPRRLSGPARQVWRLQGFREHGSGAYEGAGAPARSEDEAKTRNRRAW